MLLDEIKQMWADDAPFDRTKLSNTMYQIPMLHQKYLDILSSTKLKWRKANSDLLKMRRVRFRYYRGELTREELEEYGWSQFQGTKPLKAEMDDLLASDEVLIPLEDKVEYFKICLETLESIMKDISQRSYTLRTILEYEKFIGGA